VKIGCIGAGATATSLAPACAAAAHAVVAVTAAHPESAAALAGTHAGCRAVATPQAVADTADLVFVVVPDDRIGAVTAAVRWRSGQMAVHCAGALAASALAAAASGGAAVGALHPLFPMVRGRVADFRGAFFALEAGDARLRAVLEGVVAAAGGRCGSVPAERRALYHAAVTLVSNATVTVTTLAARCLEGAVGVPGALEAILPLLRGAVDNVARGGDAVGGAITGPIGRGDADVLSAHVKAVGEERPDLLPLFVAVERATLDLAAGSGRLTPEVAADLRRRLG
jgi:predicted short-subunit dehydrogenase-like oxidoreductase (DUF2520 family)